MIPARKQQEKDEAIALKLIVEELQKRVTALEEKLAIQDKKINITPAHGYGVFDR